MRTGVMLAGGTATRLPNKPLLPMKDGRPIICSGLDLLRRSMCSKIVVVVPPDPVICDVVGHLWEGPVEYRVQTEARGVIDAVLSAAPFAAGDVLVTFCDNIYDEAEAVGELAPPRVSVRSLRAAHRLDWWNGSQWVARREQVTAKKDCVAGWFLLHNDFDFSERECVPFLNRVHALPHSMEGEWWDVGTLETYKEYWRA